MSPPRGPDLRGNTLVAGGATYYTHAGNRRDNATIDSALILMGEIGRPRGTFDIEQIVRAFPDRADTMLVDTRLTDEQEAVLLQISDCPIEGC